MAISREHVALMEFARFLMIEAADHNGGVVDAKDPVVVSLSQLFDLLQRQIFPCDIEEYRRVAAALDITYDGRAVVNRPFMEQSACFAAEASDYPLEQAH